MKKTIIIGIGLLMAVLVQAQGLKVAPQLKKGDKRTFVTTAQNNMPGMGVVEETTEVDYVVADELPDGWVIERTVTQFSHGGDGSSDVAARLQSLDTELVKGVTYRLVTDKDGKVTSIQNYADVRAKQDAALATILDELVKNSPELAAVPQAKDMLAAQVTGKLSEESILEDLNASGPLALNGKQLTTGAQEDFVTNGLKMKRMYFVNGRSIVANATVNMSREDLKQMIITQVEQTMPEQAEVVKQNIDMMLDSGMMKAEGTDKATYELADDGWVKSLTEELQLNMMGQEISHKETTRQK